jgi:hypothetical protein
VAIRYHAAGCAGRQESRIEGLEVLRRQFREWYLPNAGYQMKSNLRKIANCCTLTYPVALCLYPLVQVLGYSLSLIETGQALLPSTALSIKPLDYLLACPAINALALTFWKHQARLPAPIRPLADCALAGAVPIGDSSRTICISASSREGANTNTSRLVEANWTAGNSPRAAHTRRYSSMPQDTDWLTQQEIATMTGKDIREVREAVRNLRRAGVIQTTVSPEDERLILVHKDSCLL